MAEEPRAWTMAVLGGIAGAVDAVAYQVLGHVYISNMTGNTDSLGMALAQGRGWHVAERACPLVAFVAGAVLGTVLAGDDAADRPAARALRARLLAVELALVVATSAMILVLAPHGGPLVASGARFYVVATLAAVAMGVQNISLVVTCRGGEYTTHVTGALTALARGLGRALVGRGPVHGNGNAGLFAGFLGGGIVAMLAFEGSPFVASALPVPVLAVLYVRERHPRCTAGAKTAPLRREPMAANIPDDPRPEPAYHGPNGHSKKRAARWQRVRAQPLPVLIAGGASLESLCGAAGLALAIIALAGVAPLSLGGVAAIVAGAGLVLFGGAVAARWKEAQGRLSGGRGFATQLAAPLGIEALAGLAGIVLGILALVGVRPVVLLAVAAIVLGAGELFGGPSGLSLDRLAAPLTGRTRRILVDGMRGSVGAMVIAGGGAVALGILAVLGIGHPLELALTGLLVAGGGLLLAGAAGAARFGVPYLRDRKPIAQA